MANVRMVAIDVARGALGRGVRAAPDGAVRANTEDDGRRAWETGQMTAEPACRTVLIVDDHDVFRVWARSFLAREGYRVVGEATGGVDALRMVRRLDPDLVLLDVHLPDVDGFEVARRLAAQPDPPTVVLISSREKAEFGARLADSAACGFVSKIDLSGQTLDAVMTTGV
jgi:CheY-like chemotaxis protein